MEAIYIYKATQGNGLLVLVIAITPGTRDGVHVAQPLVGPHQNKSDIISGSWLLRGI